MRSIHRLLLAAALAACARREPAPPAPRIPAPTRVATPAPAPAAADAAVALPTQPAVPLAEALAARRPRHEVVPMECSDHVCVREPGSELVRASLATLGAAPSARGRHEVIFVRGREMGFVESRYSGRIWRWNLTRDEVTPLNEGSGAETFEVRLQESPFGAIIHTEVVSTTDSATEYLRYDGHALVADGEGLTLPELPLGELFVVNGTLVELHRIGTCGFAVIRREGDALVREEVTPPSPCSDNSTSYSHGGPSPLFAHVIRSAQGGQLEYAVLPSREIRVVPFDGLGERVSLQERGDGLFLVGSAAALRVDKATGAATRVSLAEVPAAPALDAVASVRTHRPLIHAFDQDGLAIVGYMTLHTLGPGGVSLRRPGDPVARAAPDAGGVCACADRALVCGDRRIDDACMPVRGLLPLWRGERHPSRATRTTLTTPDGRFRLDGVDLDVLRVTRLRDGARIWVRLINAGVFVQADDGAWSNTDAQAPSGCAIRWGRDLEGSPVTPLATHRAALERPTLVADFFSDRALPAADVPRTPVPPPR
jgi:hypothetical protein